MPRFTLPDGYEVESEIVSLEGIVETEFDRVDSFIRVLEETGQASVCDIRTVLKELFENSLQGAKSRLKEIQEKSGRFFVTCVSCKEEEMEPGTLLDVEIIPPETREGGCKAAVPARGA